MIGEKNLKTVSGQNFGNKMRHFRRLIAAVKAKHDLFAARRARGPWGTGGAVPATRIDLPVPIAKSLYHLLHIGRDKVFADNGAPAVGAEFDGVVHAPYS